MELLNAKVVGAEVTEERLREVLKEADVDKDNNLSKAEIRKALKKLGSRLPPYRTWRCLQHVDYNNDGKISTSDLDDLVYYLMNFYNPPSPQEPFCF